MTRPVAFVTGSSRGIGRATAIALAKEGFAVGVNAPFQDNELETAVSAVRDAGGEAVAIPLDVANLGDHESALTALETAFGPITTLVNNAGVGVMHRGDPLEVTEESWDRCIAVNAKAPFFLTQAFARRALKTPASEGSFLSVINVTSANASAVAVPRAEYCASKAAAAMVSSVYATRLGAEGIAVYDIRPGLIATEMTAPVIGEYERRARDGLTLIPRVGQPEEIGQIIATLAAGKLPYTTGQTIFADGGMLVPRF